MTSLPVPQLCVFFLLQTIATRNLLPQSYMTSDLDGPSPSPTPDATPSILALEQRAALVLVLLLLVLLVLLMVRCFRILLDPYSSMPSSTWTKHHRDKDTLDYRIS